MIAQSRDTPTRHEEAAARGRVSHPSTNRGAWQRVLSGSCWSLLLVFGLISPVWAQGGINLSWDDCGMAGSSLKTFACDTNAGSHLLVASFTVPPGLCVFGWNGWIDLQASGSALPSWWQFKNPGTCRQSALTVSSDFTSGPPACFDIWEQEASHGLVAFEVDLDAPNRARIIIGVGTPTLCKTPPGGVETGAVKLFLSNDKTLGVGGCSGCEEGACIVFNLLRLYQNGPDIDLHSPLQRNFVTWQSAYPDCPGSTPILNRTWGAVKALYR